MQGRWELSCVCQDFVRFSRTTFRKIVWGINSRYLMKFMRLISCKKPIKWLKMSRNINYLLSKKDLFWDQWLRESLNKKSTQYSLVKEQKEILGTRWHSPSQHLLWIELDNLNLPRYLSIPIGKVLLILINYKGWKLKQMLEIKDLTNQLILRTSILKIRMMKI